MNNRMAQNLGLSYHERITKRIELEVESGEADTDFGKYHCKEVIHEVDVGFESLLSRGSVTYFLENGKVIGLTCCDSRYIEKASSPSREEIDLIEVIDPQQYSNMKSQSDLSAVVCEDFSRLHIKYHIDKERCSGSYCEKEGAINYIEREGDYRYYCGGSERCCP